jgi:hypothetical protein
MTYLEIDEALVSITRQLCTACKERLDAIPRENASERKAVQLEYGMYTFCGNAGLLFNTGWERTKVLQVRQTLWNNELHKFPHIQTQYQTLDDEEKPCFHAALHGELYLRQSWLEEQTSELEAAKTANDIQAIFEQTVKIGAVRAMFAAWEAWRKENNIYPRMFEEDLTT